MPKLKEKIKNTPSSPGVYLWKNKLGKVIYVGKAKNLRKRVTQYFGQDSREQIPFLMAEAVDLDYIVVNSELESLFLENTLIKQYMPRYNIMLRDDKNYAFIKIDYSTQIPSLGYARKVEKDTKTAKYFGPYSSARKIKQTLDFVRKIFPYCANKEVGKRPCFYYFLHRCPGVCVGQMSLEDYKKHLSRIILFLSGQTSEVKKELRIAMTQASQKKHFELAARLRDSLHALEILDERQIAMFAKNVNWDLISVFQEYGNACINLFKIREGRLIDKENFIYNIKALTSAPLPKGGGEIFETFLENYYAETSDLPREIYIESKVTNQALLQSLFKKRSGHKIEISVPTRGQKLKLIKLGVTNAREFLHKWQDTSAVNLDKAKAALEQLKIALKLDKIPSRIEGYDISNTQGTNPVGSMVVMKNGIAAKAEYRKFKINVKSTPDDFAMMTEMLSRRLSRISAESAVAKWPIPDLIVIDGGKGQLSAVIKVMKKQKLNIPIVGLAKRIEEIFLPNNPTPIVLAHDQPALQLLQRLRDEAHRFAITFHRNLRQKQSVKSALDEIPGIGPKTKKLLKEKFGTVAQIKQTPVEEIEKVIGKEKTELIKKHL